jgi:hypothetical protein
LERTLRREVVAGTHGEMASGRIGRKTGERVVALAEYGVQEMRARAADTEVGSVGRNVGPVRPPGSAVAAGGRNATISQGGVR